MITTLHLLLAFLFIGVFASVVLWLVGGVFREMNQSAEKKVVALKGELKQFDQALENVTIVLQARASAEEVQKLTKDLEQSSNTLQEQLSALTRVEAELEELQNLMNLHESKQAQLRQSKLEASALVEEIRSRQDQLRAETKKIESELSSTKNQIDSLLNEVDLTEEQRQALEEVSASLQSTLTRLNELSETYETASSRFLSLENQYVELEKEYQKIIEMELANSNPA